jgi:DNA-binding NarL/FixJ family response regulator
MQGSNQASPAQLLIADDHPFIRELWRDMLAREPDLEVIGEAEDGQEAVEFSRLNCPDLILMDIRMPRMNGLEATRTIKEECPATCVLVITAQEGPYYRREAIRAGAADCLLKDTPKQQLLDAVRRALQGEQ